MIVGLLAISLDDLGDDLAGEWCGHIARLQRAQCRSHGDFANLADYGVDLAG